MPEPSPFRPDPFQLQALEELTDNDVLVTAPTGAGKTWIALQAISRCHAEGLRSWYASPLKALSNSKYEEFCRAFGPSEVGILTGDRKENPDAPIIIGTTEILRNQLYDAMHQGEALPLHLVVLDEAHYLNDWERGVVWEEVLIYLPSRVRLLLLSATFRNADEVSSWLQQIRGKPCKVVQSSVRPVPLYSLFLFPDGGLTLLKGGRGLNSEVKRFLKNNKAKRRVGSRVRVDLAAVLEQLREWDLLPAIFFLKSRSECDRAVESIAVRSAASKQAANGRDEEISELLRRYPSLRDHRQLRALRDHRIAAHHGGHLPQWKLLVERMMDEGRLDAIFSTSTVAAGVNFPARSVVIPQSDRFNGKVFSDLTSTELHQMTGRAGRRGRDKVGFAVILPGLYQDPELMGELMESPPDPIISKVQVGFSMVLNLLLSRTPDEIRRLLHRSLAAYQDRAPEPEIQKEYRKLYGRLQKTLKRARCRRIHPSDLEALLEKRKGLQEEIQRRAALLRSIKRDLGSSRKRRRSLKSAENEEISFYERQLEGLPCSGCIHYAGCGGRKGQCLMEELSRLSALSREIQPARERLEEAFERHLEFLRETGFVDREDRLTHDGAWAAQIRIDQPLLVAEAIRRGSFDQASPEVLAGLLAAFALDKQREDSLFALENYRVRAVRKAFDRLLADISPLMARMHERGFVTPTLQYWPAELLYLWARGLDWADLLKRSPVEEGDMVMMITRTADHLRQVRSLSSTHPDLAQRAAKALDSIMRDPVTIC